MVSFLFKDLQSVSLGGQLRILLMHYYTVVIISDIGTVTVAAYTCSVIVNAS